MSRWVTFFQFPVLFRRYFCDASYKSRLTHAGENGTSINFTSINIDLTYLNEERFVYKRFGHTRHTEDLSIILA